MSLRGKRVLITGSARRIGRSLALAVAGAGGEVVIHHAHSAHDAAQTQADIQKIGGRAEVFQADLEDPLQATQLIQQVLDLGPLFALVNNAAIFESLHLLDTRLEDWNRHMAINLTAPFLLSQAFAMETSGEGRIINILDWRALRPGADHLPYTISKAGLAALTRSLALALAPRITVNGIALGAILPPSDLSGEPAALERIVSNVPAQRWADLDEVSQTMLFFLTGPNYVTGEIIHLDGGRHLV